MSSSCSYRLSPHWMWTKYLSVCSSREVAHLIGSSWKYLVWFRLVLRHIKGSKKLIDHVQKIIIFLTVSAARCAEKLIIYLFLSVMLGSRKKNNNFLISGTKNLKNNEAIIVNYWEIIQSDFWHGMHLFLSISGNSRM